MITIHLKISDNRKGGTSFWTKRCNEKQEKTWTINLNNIYIMTTAIKRFFFKDDVCSLQG